MEKYKILRVTYTVDYLIKMHDDKISTINGWTIEEIVEDWFKNHDVGSYHATRDSHAIGNSRKYVKSKVIESIEDEWKSVTKQA